MQTKILIVDDFKISNEIVANALNKRGYQTYSCQKGSEALIIIKTITIDIIITDYLMPEMTGLELLKEIREIPEYINTPVIFLSSSENKGIIDGVNKLNITAWMKKPLEIDKLDSLIHKLLTQ